MKVVCDNCSAKYQVDDEKVTNKVFKFRCKRCSHVVIIRPEEGERTVAAPLLDALESAEAEVGPEEATSQMDYGAHQDAPEGDGIWHVVVNREQIGPLTREEVLGYLGRGEINADTFGWCEGMSDWSRVGSIPEFASEFGDEDLETDQASGLIVAEASTADGSTEMLAHDSGRYEEDGDVLVSGNAGGDDADPFGAVDQEVADPFSDAGSQLRGQRNENSVLFSLDALEEAERARDAREASATGATGGSGMIDIAQLGGGQQAEQVASSSAFGASGFNPTAGAGAMPSLVTRKKSGGGRTTIIIAAAVVLLAGASLAAYFAMSGGEKADRETQAIAGTTVEVGGSVKADSTDKTSAEKVAVAKTKPQSKVTPAPSTDKPTEAQEPVAAKTAPAAPPKGQKVRRSTKAKKKRSGGSSKRKKARKSAPTPKERPVAAAPKAKPKPAPKRRKAKKSGDDVDDLLGALDGAGSSSKSKPKSRAKKAAPKPSADSLLPKKLTRSQIMSVVKKNARSVISCKNEGSGEGGTVVVFLVIGRNGAVSQARVKSAQFKGTPVGRCVERKVKRFRFPQFSGKPLTIRSLPFRL